MTDSVCVCGICPGKQAPSAYKVTLSGLANKDCTECTDLNYVEGVGPCFLAEYDRGTSTSCHWNSGVSGDCAVSTLLVDISKNGSQIEMKVTLQATSGTSGVGDMIWKGTIEDCMGTNVLPDFNDPDICDISGSTCKVKPVPEELDVSQVCLSPGRCFGPSIRRKGFRKSPEREQD